jgi:hypothetical protein
MTMAWMTLERRADIDCEQRRQTAMSVSEVSGDHCTSTKEDTNVGAPGYCGGRRGGRLAAMRVPDPELPRTIDGLVLGDGSQMSQLTARRALSAHCLEGKKTGRTRPTGSSQTHKHRVRLAACIGRQNAATKNDADRP